MKPSLEDISWVLRGRQRRDIIHHIGGMDIPVIVAEKSGYSLNNTSRVLVNFKKRGIVKLKNPKAHIGRIYELTEKGRVIRDEVKKSQGRYKPRETK